MAHAVSDDAAWHALVKDRSLQFQFPRMPPTPAPPAWLTRLADFLWPFLALIYLSANAAIASRR